MIVTFVCTGNTCRSPMAMFLLEDYIKGKKLDCIVDSCGTMNHEKPLNELAHIVLEENGISHSMYLSKPISKEIFDNSNYIFTMTDEHKTIIENMFGKNEKIISLKEVLGKDIEDPYGKGYEAYKKAFEELKKVIPKIYKVITK